MSGDNTAKTPFFGADCAGPCPAQPEDETVAKDRMTGSEMIVKALLDQGSDVVFGYPGGAVLPIYDAIFQQNHLRHILVRQEGGAVHAAEGYARSTGKVGVVLVTSGPRRDQLRDRSD